MKLFFRNFFIFTFVVLGLTTVGSQITSAQTGSSATPEQLAEINSRPEVYVKDLILDKTSYKAGDIVKGSFTLVNGKDISVSNLSYRAFLVADLIDDATYRYEFDNQVLGTLFLDKSEVKTVSFEYRLPLSSSAYTLDKQIGIKIRAFSGSGSPLGWSDTKISVTDTGITPVVIRNATVVVDGKSFLLNEGPMVYPSKKVALTLTVANTSDLDIINLTPVISVYEMDYAKDLLSTSSEKAFSLKAKSETKLNIDLPVFNYTPKVYAGELILVDQNGVTRANPIKFRYIVYGDVVNIQNVTLDKDSAKKGETVNAKLLYSGTPYDILTGAVATSTPLDLTVNLFNEKDELVATYSEKTNFVGLSTKDFDLVLMEKALLKFKYRW
jgi:hypothetical protein